MFRQKFEGVLIFAKFQEHKPESWMLLTVGLDEWLECGYWVIDVSI